MATKFVTTISMKGNFFEADIRRTMAQNKKDFIDALAEAGQSDVRAQFQAGEGSRAPMRGIEPARVSGHVVGRTHALTGKQWKATAVVSIQNRGFSKKQGIKLMIASSRLEQRVHAFRRTMGRLGRLGERTDLIKGLR